ncbi:MAG TPA: XrtA/PEP-CTERM system exopolysaccharide export protein [Steroidobacteraceae bacterium]|jgi:polysaccharide export outer membrane protein
MAGIFRRGWTAVLAIVLASMGTVACAQSPPASQVTPPAPGTTGQSVRSPTAAPAEAETPPPLPPNAVTNPDYIIGPGDSVQVFVWRNPELSVTVPVRPDGKISTPLVEDLVAVGKTPSQLAREIEKALAEYIRSPQVNIIVTNPVSTFSQIKVIGEVANPQSIPYREGLTALDVLLTVGGLTQFAAGNRAKIMRKGADGKDVEIKVRLDSLVHKGKITENVALKPGDVLVVPASLF